MTDEILYLSLNDIEIVLNTRSEFNGKEFDELPAANKQALKELALSIKTNGVIQPIVVKPLPNGKYRLIAGERRYRASLLAGKPDIPARVMDIPDDKILQFQIVENLQRKNISTIDEIRSIVRLRDEGDLTHNEIAKAIGKSLSHVDAQISISKAEPEVLDALSKNQITRTVALIIAGLDSPDKQTKAVAALKRDNPAHVVKKGDAENWIQRNFGVQQKKAFGGIKNSKPAKSNGAGGRFASDWKYYLVRFSTEQFLEWQEIVNNRTETEVFADAVEEVMSKQSGHVAVAE